MQKKSSLCNKHLKEISFYCLNCKAKFCGQCLEEEPRCCEWKHNFITIKKYMNLLENEIKKESKLDSLITMQKAIEELFRKYKGPFEKFNLLDDRKSQKNENSIIKSEDPKSIKIHNSKINEIIFILSYANLKINILIKQSEKLDSLESKEQYNELSNEIYKNISNYNECLNYVNRTYLNSSKETSPLLQLVEDKKIMTNDSLISPGNMEKELIPTDPKDCNHKKIPLEECKCFKKVDIQFFSSMTSPSKNIPFLFYLTLENCLVLHTYNLNSNWQNKAYLYEVSNILDIDAASINNLIIVCGGSNKDIVLSTTVGILMKDNDQVNCLILDNLKKPIKCSHSLISSKKNAYCIGGFLNRKHCEKYMPHKNEWTEKIPSLNFNNYLITGCALKEKFLYVFGGYISESIECLDIDLEDTWKIINLHPKDANRYWSLCIEIDPGVALIIGGSGDFNKMPKFFYENEEDYSQENACELISDNNFNGTKGIIHKNKLLFVSPYENILYEIQLSDWVINEKKLDF